MKSFMDVSIVKQKNKKCEKYCFLTQKSVKITKARSIQEKHGHFVLHQFFAKSVACNEAPKNKEFQEKTKKNQNHEGSCNLGKTF